MGGAAVPAPHHPHKPPLCASRKRRADQLTGDNAMDDRLLGKHTPRALTRSLSSVTLLTLCIRMVLALLAAAPAASAAGSQFFPQTGHAVSGPFMAYWQAHGGLPIFGYPISDAQNDVDPSSGKTLLVQWFERALRAASRICGTP